MNTNTLIGLLLVLALAPAVSATSFIQDCQYLDYRVNQSDASLTGRVTGVAEVSVGGPFGREAYTQISFDVINSTKGDVGDEFTLTQPGHLGGEGQIPAMTLKWNDADVYTIQARETEQGYQLVCGVMGRQLIQGAREPIKHPLSCRDIPSIALNPQGERVEFSSECNVPRGWTLVTRAGTPTNHSCSELPVVAMNEHGERQEYDSECDVPRGWAILTRQEAQDCAQVITYAQNPQNNAVQQFPTPCDVPQGWTVVDEPREAEHEETPEPSVWQKIRSWLMNLF